MIWKAFCKVFCKKLCMKKNLEHQTLGRRLLCPIVPATQLLEIDGFLKFTLRTCYESENFLSNSCPELSNQEIRQFIIYYARLLIHLSKQTTDQASDVPSIFFHNFL